MASAVHADPIGATGDGVMDKNILDPVGVPPHQVGGEGLESDEVASDTDGRAGAFPVPLTAGAVHAQPGDDAGATIMDKDVSDAVGVPRHQIGGQGLEGNEPAAG